MTAGLATARVPSPSFRTISVTTLGPWSPSWWTMGRRASPKPVAEWTDERHVLGHAGEDAAVAFLTGAGWRVLARRFRLGHHDLDLVVRQGAVVAFVEVKTRRSHRFGSPLQALGWRQRRAQARVAQVWMARHGRPGDLFRFDLVVVDQSGPGPPAITHVADAWRAER